MAVYAERTVRTQQKLTLHNPAKSHPNSRLQSSRMFLGLCMFTFATGSPSGTSVQHDKNKTSFAPPPIAPTQFVWPSTMTLAEWVGNDAASATEELRAYFLQQSETAAAAAKPNSNAYPNEDAKSKTGFPVESVTARLLAAETRSWSSNGNVLESTNGTPTDSNRHAALNAVQTAIHHTVRAYLSARNSGSEAGEAEDVAGWGGPGQTPSIELVDSKVRVEQYDGMRLLDTTATSTDLVGIFCFGAGGGDYVTYEDPRGTLPFIFPLPAHLDEQATFKAPLSPGRIIIVPGYVPFRTSPTVNQPNVEPNVPRVYLTFRVKLGPPTSDAAKQTAKEKKPHTRMVLGKLENIEHVQRWGTPVLQSATATSADPSFLGRARDYILKLRKDFTPKDNPQHAGFSSATTAAGPFFVAPSERQAHHMNPVVAEIEGHVHQALRKYFTSKPNCTTLYGDLDEEACMLQFKEMQSLSVRVKLSNSWANVSPAGKSHPAQDPHNHLTHKANVVGLLHIDTGWTNQVDAALYSHSAPPLGTTTIMFPPPGIPVPIKAMPAVPGTLLLFPGWVRHTMDTHFGQSDRITVAFSARVESIPDHDGSMDRGTKRDIHYEKGVGQDEKGNDAWEPIGEEGEEGEHSNGNAAQNEKGETPHSTSSSNRQLIKKRGKSALANALKDKLGAAVSATVSAAVIKRKSAEEL